MQSSSNAYIHTCSTNNQPDPSRAFSFDQIFHEIESHPSRSNTRQPALRFDEIISLTVKERRRRRRRRRRRWRANANSSLETALSGPRGKTNTRPDPRRTCRLTRLRSQYATPLRIHVYPSRETEPKLCSRVENRPPLKLCFFFVCLSRATNRWIDRSRLGGDCFLLPSFFNQCSRRCNTRRQRTGRVGFAS